MSILFLIQQRHKPSSKDKDLDFFMFQTALLILTIDIKPMLHKLNSADQQ